MAETLPVIIIAGPTAGGKSALAVALAEALGGTVINADSMQVYDALPRLTAQPGRDATARVPHRLYGVIPAHERCSAGRWLRLAADAVGEARAAGRLPVVVGGTGLYLNALMHGLVEMPEVPETVRRSTDRLMERLGPPAVRHLLWPDDPRARDLAPRDRQRLRRAWQVLMATGRPLPWWQRHAHAPSPVAARFHAIRLMPPRDALYAACDGRFDAMLRLGATAEVAALEARRVPADRPALKALGVPPLRAALAGEITMTEARRRAQRDTRRYAKRQLTWFRHQMTGGLVLETADPAEARERALAWLRERGAGR